MTNLSDALEYDLEHEVSFLRQELEDMTLGLDETDDALRSMLALFDRELPEGTVGRMVCDYARTLLPEAPTPGVCPECESSSPCPCDRYRWS